MRSATRIRGVLTLVALSLAGCALVVAAPVVAAPVAAAPVGAAPAGAAAWPVWPVQGQAAYALAGHPMHRSARSEVRPIASLAKVMTAYLVLARRPIAAGSNGFAMTVHARDVDDWHRRVAEDQSTVPVRAGERLTERQALAALLLPSANNIAIMLARRAAGSVRRFVRWMNRAARHLGMRHTTYTDPSGFDARTRSTPSDQLRLADRTMRSRFFAAMVAHRQYRIPVAGRIENTDALLRHDGFTGIKTGSMDASGGCFMFRSVRVVHGRRVALTGVVMGQHGGDLISAGLTAARRLVDAVAPRPART
jgi:D-alanyl-D-alanine carboxypeptidase (penicillin-binding protein 5/6)